MENLNFGLLLKAVEFLFVPESSLSIIFLLIFIGLFIYGLSTIGNCKKALESYRDNCGTQYEEERSRVNQKQFLSRICAAMAAKEVPVVDLPNMFVSIGILGTFIGLGVAIHGAADLLSADKVDLNKLNEVLNVIAFKFQTSVWGTVFSLVFQKFIAEPYFVVKQGMIGEIENTIYVDAVNPAKAMEWQLAELQGMHANQTVINDGLNRFVSVMTDTNARQLNELHNVTDTMAAQNKALMENTAANNSQMTKELLEKVNMLVGDTNANNLQMTQDLMKKVNQLVGDSDEQNAATIHDLLNKIQSLVNASQDSNLKVANELLEKVDAMVGDVNDTNAITIHDLLDRVNKLVNNSNDNNVKVATDILNQVKNLIDLTGKTNSMNLKELLAKVDTLVNSSNMANLQQNQELMAKVNELVSDSNMRNTKMTEDLMTKVNKLIGDASDSNAVSLNDTFAKVSELVADSKENTIVSAKTLMENVAEQLREQKKQIEELEAKNIYLNTFSDYLTITAPTDNVVHYGDANNVFITEMNDDKEFHAYGTYAYIQPSMGNIYLESSSTTDLFELKDIIGHDNVLPIMGKTIFIAEKISSSVASGLP